MLEHKMEKIVSQSEEKEMEEEEINVEEVKDESEEEEEAIAEALHKTVQSKEKKEADVLNLNNEVVKMRKEVKRVRALIIRKLTRQIGALKKKKGKEMEIERNQKRAARLLEEIHAIKVLVPDVVTKTALQKNLIFEEVCKNPKSTISDRAIARIATHPQFNKKIEDIKAAVKAFKEERMKTGKQGGKQGVQNQAVKANPQSQDEKGGIMNNKEEEESTAEYKEAIDNDKGDGILIDTKSAMVAAAHSADTAQVQKKNKPESKSVEVVSIKSSEVKAKVKDKPHSKDEEEKPNLKPASAVLQKPKYDEESDLESLDGEEKEYFDDSTEERFHKRSSQSEESDDNDFFVGKVSKFKKKKQKSEEGEKYHEIKKESTDKVQSELDMLDARLKSKATSLQSVFCSSLSGSKHSVGGGAGRGKGGENVRGKGKTKGGLSRDFSKEVKFQKQDKLSDRIPVSKYSKPEGSCHKWEEKGFASVSRGRGRGKGNVMKQNNLQGRGVFSKQTPQQALHPSWEASRKRKEQQGQILAFQGKKIKFDDDD
ncbi:Serum response factor-binding protein 1 SRF-dependent transcription regulation-associated protein [Channa argus]|uniref:Serum response factor-binding protein 1 n=1 Tax=Channa argus TaxID=215402 RepID=A0A6G1QZE9_CHAAH|nr:Serum response factor-binding protein 1 SRF-dependent transcription regulation-associated protein [Channa argus]KAK2921337.1 hypothetical protein Q8A73_000822 [Channa argus]